MARPDFPSGKCRFFTRWSLWSWGGGSRGGGVNAPYPATVYGHSHTSLPLPPSSTPQQQGCTSKGGTGGRWGASCAVARGGSGSWKSSCEAVSGGYQPVGGGQKWLAGLTVTLKGWGGGGGVWHKASVSDCLPLAAPIGLSRGGGGHPAPPSSTALCSAGGRPFIHVSVLAGFVR